MKITFSLRMAFVVAAAVTFLHQNATATTIDLGAASGFAILAGTTITDAGASKIVTGDVGLYPGTAIGLTAAQVVSGTIYSRFGDDVLLNGAKNALIAAYDAAAGASTTGTILANQLGGQTLVPGVYNFEFGTTANLSGNGILTLNGQGDPNSVWIFQVPSDLVTASGSHVVLENDANACNVFWQVTSSATLGSGSSFDGTILALTSIWLQSDVTVDGRLLARNGEVTLIDDTINGSDCTANGGGVPDTGSTLLLLGSGLGTLLAFRRRSFSPA